MEIYPGQICVLIITHFPAHFVIAIYCCRKQAVMLHGWCQRVFLSTGVMLLWPPYRGKNTVKWIMAGCSPVLQWLYQTADPEPRLLSSLRQEIFSCISTILMCGNLRFVTGLPAPVGLCAETLPYRKRATLGAWTLLILFSIHIACAVAWNGVSELAVGILLCASATLSSPDGVHRRSSGSS